VFLFLFDTVRICGNIYWIASEMLARVGRSFSVPRQLRSCSWGQ
jgi:hypothetical protein